MKFLNLAVFAATTAFAAPQIGTQVESSKRTLYFLDSDPKGASIVAIPIGEDGRLQSMNATGVVRTPTGGRGGIGMGMNGTVSVDPLFSQDSVVVKGSRLFTVNAGNNTLSRFYIPQNDPLHPKLVGKPVATGGEFPNTVAYSEKNQLACVANTGKKAGVQCFRVPECDQLEPVGDFMPLPINQTSPPMGPANTVSDIVFNPSESALFVSVKGDGMGKGYLYAYRVNKGEVDPKPIISRPEELRLDFSLSFLSDSDAVITDPAYGASRLSISPDLSVSVTNNVTIPGQTATCWSVYSPEFQAVYVFDGASPNVTALSPETGDIKFVVPGEQRGMGSFDAVAERSWLYVLQASPAIAVFDLKASEGDKAMPRITQYLDLASLGNGTDRSSWIGLAVYSG
ncbi:3-carboxymuconate cyclase [Hirsutella rhossiliensis]|uniref:3-carboxymuconate cyclase n=1 Tax=Hirsutella rhossiliensis TaxID=111463 RepID=A0A9P8SMW3_9HYPO|nr:3-carboxymuconate cyclase [Hirsutella rhossiliensis]KAH0967729.1 3-carboxymuconate cyclase [Hirsutella rhossiliensis]